MFCQNHLQISLAWNSQVSWTNLELCIVRILIPNPYLLEDVWLLADLLIKTLHLWHVYTWDFFGSFEVFVSITKEKREHQMMWELVFVADWIVKHPTIRKYVDSSVPNPVGVISSVLRRYSRSGVTWLISCLVWLCTVNGRLPVFHPRMTCTWMTEMDPLGAVKLPKGIIIISKIVSIG